MSRFYRSVYPARRRQKGRTWQKAPFFNIKNKYIYKIRQMGDKWFAHPEK
jgi:hypothetical protein